jgi:hypothetical protein
MKFIGDSGFVLKADDGEQITVKVRATGTTFLVNYLVEGARVVDGPNEGSMQEGVSLRVELDGSAGGRNDLHLGFTFATPEEAAGQPVPASVGYSVEITSATPGSDVAREFVSGAFGIPADARQWIFSL